MRTTEQWEAELKRVQKAYAKSKAKDAEDVYNHAAKLAGTKDVKEIKKKLDEVFAAAGMNKDDGSSGTGSENRNSYTGDKKPGLPSDGTQPGIRNEQDNIRNNGTPSSSAPSNAGTNSFRGHGGSEY